MCQTSQREDREITAARCKQEDDMMMTINKRPLIMMWSKTAPKETKMALPHQQ